MNETCHPRKVGGGVEKSQVLERSDLGNGMRKFSWLDLANKRRKPKAIGLGKRDVPSYSDG